MTHHVKINELTLKLVEKIIENKDFYKAEIHKFDNGATVLDMTNASWNGGKLVGEICMGGLGTVDFTSYNLDGHYIPSVNVYTSEPIISCMASQLAGWKVKLKKEVEKEGVIKKKTIFQSLGSGPARVKSKVEKLFEEIKYTDDSDCAVIVFETAKLPNEEVMAIVAEKCGVDASKTYAVCAPTACLTGSIQVAARIVETGIHKLHEIHFPLDVLKDGFGMTTIAPIAKDDLGAMGRTNDSISAAGMTYYTIDVEKDKQAEIFDLLKKAPANTSSSYGRPFIETFKAANYDFYAIDPGLFAPAIYTVTNVQTGKSITVGEINHNLLKESYKLN
ncbi:MAG: methenyltetrahydromethanopterin cyclohydrolase [Promethearchaeota archaeon Loki_b31]|nr:MAG: methenyltetrahydromethanopterin cyclohydrolase [Candidatus Lokiarchaeota archaeon Loki_b31]